MFSCKIHKTENDIILAVCDSDIIGKTFREGKLKLEIRKYFYYEKKAGNKEISELFKKANIINLSGEKIIAFAVKEKWIDENSIITINGVPHAQIIKM